MLIQQSFIESETEWDSEPTLSDTQKDFLLTAAVGDDGYTIDSLGAVIYLGLSWKLAKAVELHAEGGEQTIYDHLKEQLARWSQYADPELGASAGGFQLVELEVGQNFLSTADVS